MIPEIIITIIATSIIVYLFIHLKTQRRRLNLQVKSARTQRDEARKELDEVILDNKVTLDALGDAFFVVTRNLDIRKTNSRAKEIFRNQELTGRNLPEILMNPTFTENIQHMIQLGKASQKKLTLSASSHALGGNSTEGETAWVIQVTPLPNHKADPLHCIILRDVSTEHRTEQIRTDFVANASHELRTPLAIINGYLENLIDDDVLEEPEISRRILITMRRHGSRLSRLVDDMLVVSRLESGESAALNSEPFDLIECAEDVLARLDQLITTSNATVIREYKEPELVITGDRFYWTQVMFNLVENAIKQNPERELKVTIAIKKLGKENIQIKISDNGIGIPSSHLPFIFKRFYRVDKHHTQSDIKGTGLGLSIVKRAIEAHNGTIEATSKPGIRTTFTIITPSTQANHPNNQSQ
ncbi:ATP-binding protein [Rubritalea spongiae]|uniref:histidine kinase n=1 Tax=Rubritalea spongiae TaxID=430797 RepID=A0ABW5E8Q9_9BACT